MWIVRIAVTTSQRSSTLHLQRSVITAPPHLTESTPTSLKQFPGGHEFPATLEVMDALSGM